MADAVLRLSCTVAPGMPRRTTSAAGWPAVTVEGLAASVRAGVAVGDGAGSAAAAGDAPVCPADP